MASLGKGSNKNRGWSVGIGWLETEMGVNKVLNKGAKLGRTIGG